MLTRWNPAKREVEVVEPGYDIRGNALPVPSSVTQHRFSDDEAIIGDINGSNLIFDLARIPTPAASLILVVDDVVFNRRVHYSLSGRRVTCTAGNAPIRSIAAWFRY